MKHQLAIEVLSDVHDDYAQDLAVYEQELAECHPKHERVKSIKYGIKSVKKCMAKLELAMEELDEDLG